MCSTIVVGMPVDMLGKAGEQVCATERFISSLRHEAPWVRIITLDERLTMQEARERLNERGVDRDSYGGLVDGMAAVILLERYFSDGDDMAGVLVQKGGGAVEVQEASVAERRGFADWKKETMERARRTETDIRGRRQGQKNKQIGRREPDEEREHLEKVVRV